MDAEIISNTRWGQKYGTLTLSAPGFTEGYRAGQMCMLGVQPAKSVDPLLRRPFAPYSVSDDGTLSIIYAVVGRGTEILSRQPAGTILDLSLPHGNHFKLAKNVKTALVAGGVGIAPIHYLAGKLIENSCQVDIYYGGRTSADIYPELKSLPSPYGWFISTEDGSFGEKGLVTSMLADNIDQYASCYSCGPMPMMKAAFDICKANNTPLQVSLEKTMACGIGVCSGCMVDIKKDNEITTKRCCTEGPVFDAYSVVW